MDNDLLKQRNCLSTLDVEDVSMSIDLELLLLGRSLSWVWSLEDLLQLFQSAALGFWNEEVDDSGLDQTPDDEDDVSLPLDLLEGNWPGELVEKTGGVDGKGGESHTLSTLLEGQDFDWVESLEWGETNGVEDTEDENETDGGTSCVDVVWVGVVGSSAGGNSDPDDGERDVDEEEERTTTKSVNEEGTADSEEALDEGKTQVDVEDGLWVGNTGGGKETSQEVGDDTVTGPLSEDRDSDVASNTIARGTITEESRVIPETLVSSIIDVDSLEFSHLKLDVDGVWVTVTVVLGKDSASLLITVVDTQPTWRFWEEEDEENDDSSEESLEDSWDQPLTRVSVGELNGSTGDTTSEDGTGEPEAVVETSQGTTVERMGDFDDVSWTSGGGDGDTETEEETTGEILWERGGDFRGGLNDGTEDDDGAANEHTHLTAPGIDSWANEWKSGDTTNLVHGGNVSSLDTNVVGIEVVFVGRHDQEGTHERTIITVHGGAEESEETEGVESDGVGGPWLWWFFDQSCGQILRSLDELDFRDLLSDWRGSLFVRSDIFLDDSGHVECCWSSMLYRLGDWKEVVEEDG